MAGDEEGEGSGVRRDRSRVEAEDPEASYRGGSAGAAASASTTHSSPPSRTPMTPAACAAREDPTTQIESSGAPNSVPAVEEEVDDPRRDEAAGAGDAHGRQP